MGRPVTKSELLSAAAENYEEMNKMISSMTEKELSTPFDFPGKKEAHWTREANNTELADIRGYLAISKSAISQMLTALEKKGYINRTVNPENRKNLIVTLAPLGRECLNEIDSVYNCRFEQVAEGIGEENMKEMIRLINLMNDTVDKLNDMEDAK